MCTAFSIHCYHDNKGGLARLPKNALVSNPGYCIVNYEGTENMGVQLESTCDRFFSNSTIWCAASLISAAVGDNADNMNSIRSCNIFV